MFIGILCALCAGLMWGLVFVTPLLLADYPGVVLSLGRYVAFGLIALVPALFDRKRISLLSRQDWKVAFKLSLVGNLLYYATLATAIQLADAPLPTMLIGTLPIVISVCANWRPGHASEAVAWRRLAPSLVILGIGLMLVNSSELARLREAGNARTTSDYALGCLLAVGAVAGWTWYPIVNSRYLRTHTHINSITWATAQGLATLPMALAGFALYGIYGYAAGSSYDFPLGPCPAVFVLMMLLIGLLASWLAALLYAFLLRDALPDWKIVGGIVFLCVGVVFGVRTFSRRAPVSSTI